MRAFKILSLIIIGVYVVIQLISTITQCSGLRTVTVYRETRIDSNTVVRPFKASNTPVEVFEITVNPKNFWDKLLLTRDSENVLVDLLKIASALVFAWYLYKLNYDNVFSKRSLNLFWAGLSLCVIGYIATDIGADHTRDFCGTIAIAKGDNRVELEFDSSLKRDKPINNYWLYVWVPMILINFYKTFNRRHDGKPEEGWFGDEEVVDEKIK